MGEQDEFVTDTKLADQNDIKIPLRYLHVSKKETAKVESLLDKLKRNTNNKNFFIMRFFSLFSGTIADYFYKK